MNGSMVFSFFLPLRCNVFELFSGHGPLNVFTSRLNPKMLRIPKPRNSVVQPRFNQKQHVPLALRKPKSPTILGQHLHHVGPIPLLHQHLQPMRQRLAGHALKACGFHRGQLTPGWDVSWMFPNAPGKGRFRITSTINGKGRGRAGRTSWSCLKLLGMTRTKLPKQNCKAALIFLKNCEEQKDVL